jgi:hypothetical protein
MNLPKPSRLKRNGTEQEQIDYLTNYLVTLVNALDTKLKGSKETTEILIKDVSVVSDNLVVTYSDGQVKRYPI